MYKNIGNYYYENGHKLNKEAFSFEIPSDQIIYEVLRVIDNHPLFLDDHMERLKHSLDQVGMKLDIDLIKSNILELIECHPSFNKNIKIDVYDTHYRVYFMESFYPEQSIYDRGVPVKTYKHERDNPTIKALNMDYKAHIESLKEGVYFEILLENHLGFITEGSRSNLVFVKGSTLYSAPLDEILNGITFMNVVKMAKKLGYKVKYQSVHRVDLNEMDAAFLTGTSLGVLPIEAIDDLILNSSNHPVVKALMHAYNERI